VWVDEDYIRENHSIWELLRRIPQVKGTFDTHDPILYNSRGEREDYQCLILEHQKELSGTSLSDGRTTSRPSNQTMLVIDRRLSSRQWRMSQWNQFAHGIPQWSPYTYRWSDTPGKMTGHVLLPKYSREPEWVVKPDGDVCTYCDRLITDDQPVAVEYTFPDDMQIKALNGTFEWVKKRHHLDCMVRFMIEPPMFTSNDTISILGGV